jgi:hypothetical protein
LRPTLGYLKKKKKDMVLGYLNKEKNYGLKAVPNFIPKKIMFGSWLSQIQAERDYTLTVLISNHGHES